MGFFFRYDKESAKQEKNESYGTDGTFFSTPQLINSLLLCSCVDVCEHGTQRSKKRTIADKKFYVDDNAHDDENRYTLLYFLVLRALDALYFTFNVIGSHNGR